VMIEPVATTEPAAASMSRTTTETH
jgi:hypothetical protein